MVLSFESCVNQKGILSEQKGGILSERYRKMLESWIVLFGLLFLTVLSVFYMFKRLFYTTEIEKSLIKQDQINQVLQEEIKIRTSAEVKRDTTIQELKQAIDEVKKLRGILPICASCKKIRDDKGAWNQIESYIKERSEAEFSHSICPDCANKLYPEFYDNNHEDTYRKHSLDGKKRGGADDASR